MCVYIYTYCIHIYILYTFIYILYMHIHKYMRGYCLSIIYL
jgi:hypothetical protein